MNVAFYSNQFAESAGHGIARYARHLYHALRRQHPDIGVTPVATWSNRCAKSLEDLKNSTGLHILPWGRKLTPIAWTYFGYPRIENWVPNVDVVHAVSLGYPIATRKPYVVTVHDIGPLTYPEYFAKAPPWIMKKSLKHAIKYARAFVCVSEATANELKTYVEREHKTKIDDRVSVVLEGVEKRFYQAVNESCLDNLALPDAPFIMTAGAISPRKNVQGVIEALASIKDKIPHHFVAVGGAGWDTDVVGSMLADTGLEERVHLLGYVSDLQLQALYGRASVYLHPSFFEGFGLTVLEAMAASCPVVTSNVFSLPEVAGNAAILVDPSSSEAIADGIERICTNDEFANELVARGLDRARQFTWEKCADGVAATYDKVLN